MGRKERHDIDYFPFFIKDGRTLYILEAKYQSKGTGFFTNLFRFLSRTPDHHFQIKDESDQMYLIASTKCDPESALDMIQMMVATGKLDRELWERFGVLASSDFLDSIQEAYRKRSNNCITLQEIIQFYEITSGRNQLAGAKLPEEIALAPVSSGIYPYSKVKKNKEEESKEEKRTTVEVLGRCSPPDSMICPHTDIIALYHQILPELPQVMIWPESCQKTLRARWREDVKRQDMGWWEAYFEYVKRSDFLMGRDKDWSGDLLWMIKPSNMTKILNGSYHKQRQGGLDSWLDQRTSNLSD